MAAAALQQLLEQLAAADGLSARLRIVRQSYDLVRSLSPHERERIAMKVGSQWAWRHLEKLLSRDGELDEADELALRAVDKLGGADPRELAQAARAARRGDFEQLKQAALEATRDVLPSEPALIEVEDLQTLPEPAREARAPVEAELVEPAPVEPALDQSLVRPEAPTVTASAAATREPPRFVALDWETPQPAEEPVSAHSELETSDELASSAPFVTARDRLAALRRLREEPLHGSLLGRDGRARLLARLGAGWPARRAISELIRSASFEDLDEALSAIGRLDTPTRRAWCLGDLIEHSELDSAQAARVLDAAPSPAARLRLERRHTLGTRAAR